MHPKGKIKILSHHVDTGSLEAYKGFAALVCSPNTFRDKNTLYRYYDENDLKKARLIKRLRSLDFSILEMKEALEMVNNEADLTYILREKIVNIKENMACFKNSPFI